ncbi:patatin-domain-containing protein [Fomitiporia mediterranea MF3/22]|uniref:patatin-domain-containing protein n=1 Tax=Fomitiporia mediterranea (strain MF3/22) TaxID=694068 RepID=UPI0004408391|nr:patatin-domain-containing protein [Fomitiporia mediterranea MF3/22]EJD03753.1 patatin-domain-containing protein [Fomitiporia mediterranea MF3/22]
MDLPSDPQELHVSTTHPLLSLVAAVFWALLWLLSWAKSLIAFATISVPRFIYAVLSYSLTFTLNFWSFVIIFIASAVALNYFIRFRYLNVYSTLKEPPLVRTDAKELHPDVNATEAPPNFHNYLDDFLEAVRIFGFLEKPVFHELARHLQTRRLIAGDSISLNQDKNFYCVIDGLVQVHTRTGDAQPEEGSWEDGSPNGYQLLNEVGSGGTLSSLFTILSLFTENVRISWQDDEVTEVDTDQDHASTRPTRTRMHRSDSDVSNIDLDGVSAYSSPLSSRSHSRRRPSVSSSGSTIHGDDSTISSPNGRGTQSFRRESSSYIGWESQARIVDNSIVALAVEDATLAVIPAEAFRRLVKQFPKASAHIVQVILTRFSRVTINAAHKYLGLTTEVIRTEKAINEIACHPLPNRFYEGGGLHALRHKFDKQSGEESPEPERDYFSPIHSQSPSENGPYLSHDHGVTESPLSSSQTSLPRETFNPKRTHSSRHLVQAGDLHTSAILSDPNRFFHRPFSTTGTGNFLPSPIIGADHHLHNDDFDLREEVMSCIAKSIGLRQPPLSGIDSVEASPAFSPVGSRSGDGHERNQGFTSFGSLSLLETVDDASSSVTGESAMGSVHGVAALDNEVEILYFAAGSTLARAGERHPGLFYVIDGILDISLPLEEDTSTKLGREEREHKPAAKHRSATVTPTSSNEKRRYLFTVKPGGIAGYMSSLCGIPSYVDITAKMDTYVGFLPYNALERLLEKRPIVLLTLAKRLISLLSPLVLHIDASLDWMQVTAGKVLWRPGDPSDSFYIVVNGRLRAIDDKEEGKVKILGEYGQGDPVGELDVITRSPRRNTVHAIRDTELVRMPLTLFNAISARNPQVTSQLLRLIASRVRNEVDISSSGRTANATPELGWNNLNLKTVAIMPISRAIPIEAFAKKLQSALESFGAPTAYLNQASISRSLGRHAFTRMGKLKVAGWLADQEQRYRTVLYVVDSPVNSNWTQTCIRQADCVMVVGAGDDPSLGEYERFLMSVKTTARKELILLHPERSVVPGSTREWLKIRPWISRHFHVELPGITLPVGKTILKDPDPAAVTALKNLKDKVQSEIQKFRGGRDIPRPQRPAQMSDFARLARRICGKSVGLILGGGGARGLSHLGLIQAMEERGIPIDQIGGTSIGAFVGGLFAREGDLLSSAGRIKQYCARMGNIWRLLSDLTYPIVAYTTGHEFNRAIYKSFYDLHIEDMWIPFFCNTTNILTSRMEIHESGYAWRYIRASMTLVGLLPPLCDNGNMLVDGGYMDNLPVSTMLAMGASVVFASDVASIDDNSPRNFGDSVSGVWLFINRWNPFSSARKIPPITEIQSRLAYVSSVKTLEEAKAARGCFYMQLPVQDYGTMQFNKYEEIERKGYQAAVKILQEWEEDGRLAAVLEDLAEVRSQGKRKGLSARRNSI